MHRRAALVVDPEQDVLRTLAAGLGALGLEVATVRDATGVVERLDDEALAVVLLAADAPGAPAFVEAARARRPGLPVIVTAAPPALEDAIRLHPFEVLAKPVVAGELRLRVGRALSAERSDRTRALLLRLGEAAASGPPDGVPVLAAESLRRATESRQAGIFLRRGDALVPRAVAGSEVPAPPLVATANATAQAGQRQADRGSEGLSVAAPLVIAGNVEGAIAVLAPTEAAPLEETLDRIASFATVVAGLIAPERALSRQRDAALEAVHRLVSRSAHEINNPLGGLKLYIRLIEQRLAKSGDTYGEGLAQKVEHAIDRLTGLVADLAGHGRPPGPPTQRVAVHAALAEVLTRVRDRLTTGAVEVTVELGDAVGSVNADREALGRIFFHLVANALDATPPGGRLTVKSRRSDATTVEVVIEDGGNGMDAETLARAGALFFTTRQHAAGLGLATVHSAVEALGGRLEIESEPGRGTRVAVRLPAVST